MFDFFTLFSVAWMESVSIARGVCSLDYDHYIVRTVDKVDKAAASS